MALYPGDSSRYDGENRALFRREGQKGLKSDALEVSMLTRTRT